MRKPDFESGEAHRSLSEIVNEAVRLALMEDQEDLGAFEAREKEPTLSYAESLECTGINDIATVAVIEKDSFIIPFTVYPPDTSGNPETGDKRSYYSTREQKKFAFNFSYSVEHDGKATHGNASQQIELRFMPENRTFPQTAADVIRSILTWMGKTGQVR